MLLRGDENKDLPILLFYFFFRRCCKHLLSKTHRVEVVPREGVLHAQGWAHRSRVSLLMTVVACVSMLRRAVEIVSVVVIPCLFAGILLWLLLQRKLSVP